MCDPQSSTKKLIALLFTGHVGSSWLMSLLDGHPRISQLGFEPVDDLTEIGVEASPYFDRVVHGEKLLTFPEHVARVLGKKWDTQPWQSFEYIAFKARVNLQLQRPFFSTWLPAAKPVVILLRRRNKIKNAISQFKRTQLNISHLLDFERTEQKRRPIRVDGQYILNQATQFTLRELRTAHYFRMLTACEGISGIEVCYEDLLPARNCADFLSALYKQLGLSQNPPLASRYHKMTVDSIRDAVENYHELTDEIRGSIFEPSLADDHYDVVQEIQNGNLEFPPLRSDESYRLIGTLFS